MGESDGIEEAVEGMFRVGLTVAGRLGEQLARAREQELRRAQATEEQQARELQARFDAERAAARAQLVPVMDNRWWDTASGRDIERVHQAATGWKDHDPTAASAAEVIRDQVHRRYGLDVNNLGADSTAVAVVLAEAEQERRTGRDQTVQALRVMADTDREDSDRQHQADQENQTPDGVVEEAARRYDSAERRHELAVSLEGISDREAVQARLTADQDQATPAAAAVARAPGRSPKARRTRGANGQAKLLQRGMSR